MPNDDLGGSSNRNSPSDELTDLNERYYVRSPHLYFEQRLNCLTVVASQLPEYGDRLRAGLEIGDLSIIVDADERVDSPLDHDELLAYVTSETEVLLYHAAESMFRVYLAHAERPDCPWLALASPSSIGGFRKQVARRFGGRTITDATRTELERCLRIDLADRSTRSLEEFEQGIDNLLAFLRSLAERLAKDHELYNAAKHGFTMLASTAYFALHDGRENPVITYEGPSLEYLRVDPWSKGDDPHREWSSKTVWVNLVLWWTLTHAAAEIMRSVWTIGRRSFVGPQEGDRIWIPTDLSPQQARAAAGGSGLGHLNRPLFLEFKGPRKAKLS